MVAMVVLRDTGRGSSAHPAGDSGSVSGAANDRAVTVASAIPTPRSPRIIDVAWYR